ncbi:hypothetical protein EVAR_66803_1 [Eumeta japonica]|uniref:Uncharacterized protein n=1 Tax=Eumeta variegata TaxID=151549 RepID=A0A4C2A0J3_EUMVA|nr:hypothetical protein EVAR_66803_1 [Eumeta japonica]
MCRSEHSRAEQSRAAARNLGERRASAHAHLELVYLVTAFVPSLTACFANSPGSSRRTEVCTSLDVIVERVDDDAGMRNSFSNEQYCGPEKGRFSESAYATADCGLRLLFGLLRQQYRLNVRQYASLGDRHAAKELVQLLVVAYRELKMSRDDPGLLVVARRVTGQLEHLGGEIFHNGGQVDGSTGADALRIVTLAQQPMNTADGEFEDRLDSNATSPFPSLYHLFHGRT